MCPISLLHLSTWSPGGDCCKGRVRRCRPTKGSLSLEEGSAVSKDLYHFEHVLSTSCLWMEM